MADTDEDEPEMVTDNIPDVEPTDSAFYGFLNVPRTASQDEITAAYKRLARLYHPDKHQDPEKRSQAEMLFAKLKKSYEVLSDPHKRAIYDCLGEKGLEEQGWEIVQRRKTPQEIREEYEALAKAREERRLQQKTNPTSRFEMTVNATDLFDRYLYDSEYDDLIEGDFPHFEVSKMSLSQSIQAPLTSTDTATLSGNLHTSNGTGGGSVCCAYRRVNNEGAWQEAEVGVGNGLNFGAKMYRKLSERIFVNMSGSLQFTSKGLKPGFECSLGSHLDKYTAGYLRYSTNFRLSETEDSFMLREEDSGMCTMIVRNTEKHQTTASLQLGIPYTYIMLAHTMKIPEKKRKFRGALKAGTFGAILEYGVEEKITQHSSLGATMVVGTMGVICKLKLTRATQTYLFPFQLSDEVMLQPIFYGTVAPLIAWLTVKKLILEPMELKRKEEARAKQKQSMKEKVAAAKQEAEASLNLMEERFRRGLAEEESKNGLIIEQCLYGLLSSDSGQLKSDIPDWGENNINMPDVTDITKAVQCNVEHSRLLLWEGDKSSLPGVWDPCPGEEKWLLIRYTYQGTKHQLFCPENDAVKLPKTSHRF